jgi:hypothetical protein
MRFTIGGVIDRRKHLATARRGLFAAGRGKLKLHDPSRLGRDGDVCPLLRLVPAARVLMA